MSEADEKAADPVDVSDIDAKDMLEFTQHVMRVSKVKQEKGESLLDLTNRVCRKLSDPKKTSDDVWKSLMLSEEDDRVQRFVNHVIERYAEEREPDLLLVFPESEPKQTQDDEQRKEGAVSTRKKGKQTKAGKTKTVKAAPEETKKAKATKTAAKATTKSKANGSVKSAATAPAKGKPKGKAKGKSGSGSKLQLIRDLLVRKAGCTAADILKVTGWERVTVPPAARALGLKLKKVPEGRTMRYFGS